jgi:hypothetical protein
MKIIMWKSFKSSVAYGYVDLNKSDYPELQNLSDEEAVAYLNENIRDFELQGFDYSDIPSQLEFEGDELKSKITDEEYQIQLA